MYLFVVLVAWLFGASSSQRLVVDGKWLKDEQGRVRILRGYNIAADSKVPDFMPLKGKLYLLDSLPGLGVDIVRLLFIWEAYEATPNNYNHEYITYILEIVQHLGSLGIYVLVDLHQDGFSRWSLNGCGDGFPQWTVPVNLQHSPDNSAQNCSNWGLMLLEPEMETVYSNLYNNEDGIKSAFFKVIQDVGHALSSQKNVVGFDLMNEPKGDEVTQLAPYYEEVAALLLNISSDYLTFFEPQQLVTSGLVTSQLPKPTYQNAVFAPHFYNPISYLGYYDYGVQTRVGFNHLKEKADELEVPWFMGEFGCKLEQYTSKYINDYYMEMDNNFVGGTQWTFTPTWNNVTFDGWNGENFSIVDDMGDLRSGYVLRPSVRAIPGTPLSFYFDSSLVAPLEFYWQHNESLGNATMSMYLPLDSLGYSKNELQISKGLICAFGGYKNLYLECSCTENCMSQKFVRINLVQ